MSKSELIQHLYNEINRQNTWYMWTVGTLVVIIGLVIGFFAYLTWRMSDKQIDKLKTEIKQELSDKFNPEIEKVKLSELNDVLMPFNDIISTRPRQLDDSTLIFLVLNSLQLISQMKDDDVLRNVSAIPNACTLLFNSLNPELLSQKYIYGATLQIQELLKTLYPTDDFKNYHNEIARTLSNKLHS
ncbi:hypothetical protein [Paucilactobacillus sp. N302-9]